MEAPEKIYLQVCGDCEENECQSCKFEDLEDNVTWSRDPIFNKDIEYVCTNVFIEKAWDWIEDNLLTSNQQDKSRLYFEQFRRHMKGG